MRRNQFLFENIQKGKILDVGNLAKQGKLHKELIERLSDCKIFGLDVIDQKNIGLTFANQFLASAETMPFAAEYFDTVYLGEVIEHSWQPKKLIEECCRVLKKNGTLVLDTPNIYALSRILRYLITGKDVILGDPDHKIFYSRAMMENLLMQSGFEIIKIEADSLFTVKSKSYNIPAFGSLKYLGEHLMAVGIKK